MKVKLEILGWIYFVSIFLFFMAAIDELMHYLYSQVPEPNIQGYSNSSFNSSTPNFQISNSLNNPFAATISKYSNQHMIDPEWVTKVINQESMFNPRAVSESGAQGLGQLMPNTAMGLGVKDPFDPEQNIAGTTKYLSQLLKRFNNDKTLATAAYNAGPGAVEKYKGIPPYKQTQHYVNKILGDQLATSY